MKTIADIQGDPEFAALSREDQAQVLEAVKPGFMKLDSKAQDDVIGHLTTSSQPMETQKPLQAGVTESVNPIQGISNVLGSVAKGVGGAIGGIINPSTYTNLAQMAGSALQTEAASRQAESAGTLPDPNHYGRPTALDLISGGTRNLINGVASLPADIGNAYQGREAYKPLVDIQPSPREQFLRQNYPASLGLGDQLPYALPVGGLGRGAGLGELATEGAAIGALQDSDGLSGRVANAALGAATPVAAGKLIKGIKGRVVKEAPLAEIPNQPELPSLDVPVSEAPKLPEVKQSGFAETVKQSSNKKPGLEINNEYEVINNKETLAKAQAKIDADPEGSYDEVLRTDSPTADTYATAQDLMRRYQNEGNFDRAIEVAEHVARKATEQGQAIQALSMWGRLTPEGALVAAERVAQRAGVGESKAAVKSLQSAVQRFKNTGDAVVAKRIQRLAQKTSRASFKKALSSLSQDEVNALGRVLGC